MTRERMRMRKKKEKKKKIIMRAAEAAEAAAGVAMVAEAWAAKVEEAGGAAALGEGSDGRRPGNADKKGRRRREGSNEMVISKTKMKTMKRANPISVRQWRGKEE